MTFSGIVPQVHPTPHDGAAGVAHQFCVVMREEDEFVEVRVRRSI